MKKNLNYYLNLKYTTRIQKNSDGSFFAEIEELPGCMTEADSLEEIVSAIDDAKKEWLASAIERKLIITEPSDTEFSGKFNVRVPRFLHRKLTYRAKQEGVSLNSLITTTLANSV